MRSIIPCLIPTVVALVLLPGCKPPTVSFNDTIVTKALKLHEAGIVYGRALGSALASGNEKDVSKAEAAYEDVLKALTDVRNDIKALTVPPGKAAKEFQREALEFLDIEERLINRDFKDMLRITKEKGTNQADKSKRVNDILAKAVKIEKEHLEWLKDAQRKYAEENKITLKQK
jgi:hypothetical protein